MWHPPQRIRHVPLASQWPDAARADALVEFGNDPAFDAVWFARGGYGA